MPTSNYGAVVRTLIDRYSEPAASVKETPWESLLFTALSARSRDDQTEPVFRALIAAYPAPADLAKAKRADVERILKHIGLFRSKAKNVIAMAEALMERHGGRVPSDMDALVALPGVGRKTASCVLVYAYGIPAIAVDTHVLRIVNRLGWVKEKTPEKTERSLRRTLPKRFWIDINRVMVSFGRAICVPGRPKCWRCPVRRWCAYPKKTPAPKK